MDFKDIMAIVFTIILVGLAKKFMPNNPLSILINYVKACFKIKDHK